MIASKPRVKTCSAISRFVFGMSATLKSAISGRPERGEVLDDPEPGAEDQRVPELEPVEVRGAGLGDLEGLERVAHVEREDQLSHAAPSSRSSTAAAMSGKVMVASA